MTISKTFSANNVIFLDLVLKKPKELKIKANL